MIEEREFTESEAEHRLHALCNHLGLSAQIKNSPLSSLVATCDLIDNMGSCIASGAGKGHACKVGALAESIEHHFTTDARYNQTVTCSGKEITLSPALQEDWLLQAIPDACAIPSYSLVSLGQSKKIKIPAVLLTPTQSLIAEASNDPAYAFLGKYASNSGTAIGCTESEALLHAVNESVERHALSNYYLSLCDLAPPLKLYSPNPLFLQKTFAHCTELLQCAKTLNIYMTDYFFGLFFCIASPGEQDQHTLAIVGSGCSLNPSVALSRAVTEQIQSQSLSTHRELNKDENTLDFLTRSPRLEKLINPIPSQEPELFHPTYDSLTTPLQTRKTIALLTQNKNSIFYRHLFNHPELACALQVYIPGFDRFHLIRSGVPVAPQYAFAAQLEQHHGLT